MDKIRNPFQPGAGCPPDELVGREEVMENAAVLFARIRRKRAEKSLLLTGLRGVGKTVLLNHLERIAEEEGFHTIMVEAHENKPLGHLLAPHLKSLLHRLDRTKGAAAKLRRGLAVLKSFVSSLKVKVDDFEFGLDIEPEKGSADSGDLEIDLPELLRYIGEAAEDRGNAVAILIDEIQYFTEKELSALVMGMHRMQQRQLPVVLVGAGLPILPRLPGESKSYAERLFDFPVIGPLNEADSRRALVGPVRSEGVEFEEEALAEIIRLTKGYPYFLQEWGYQSWNMAESSPITRELVEEASEKTRERLDQNFFRVRFDRLTNGERKFLRAMAEIEEAPYATGDIAKELGVQTMSLGPRRAAMIK